MNSYRVTQQVLLLIYSVLFSPLSHSNELRIDVNIPKHDVNPYHKPYVAIWLETTQREPVATVALWVGKDTWLKDLRQWWRKIGRSTDVGFDGFTGATRSPGSYSIQWTALDGLGKPLKDGAYLLNIEVSREEGGRSYVRKRIVLGHKKSINILAEKELGEITIYIE